MSKLNRDERQVQIATWVRLTFGKLNSTPHERIRRFVEEALEMAQSAGMSLIEIQTTARHVYSRTPGDLHTEIGDVGVDNCGFKP